MSKDPRQGGGSNFPYILLNEIQTMFSQLAKQSVRFWSADMHPTRAQMLHVPTELGRMKGKNYGGQRRRIRFCPFV